MPTPTVSASTQQQSAANVSGDTVAHTVAAGLASGALLVSVGYFKRTVNITGMTYAGQAMSLFRRFENGSAQATIELWYLLSPPAGTDNVVFTFSGALGPGNRAETVVSSWSDINGTTPIEAASQASVVTGVHTAHSLTLTPVTDGAVLLGVIVGGATTAAAPVTTGAGILILGGAGNGNSRAQSRTAAVTPPAATSSGFTLESTSSGSAMLLVALPPSVSPSTSGRWNSAASRRRMAAIAHRLGRR